MSALPNPTIPLSMVVCDEILTVVLAFNVFVFESAIVLLNVANIFTVWPAKLAPKSKLRVLPVGEPPKLNIASPSWLLPDKFKVSPTAPVPPEPVDITDTEKSLRDNEANVSFVPAEIVISPFDDKSPLNCLLTLKFVSVWPAFVVVFNVLTVL